MYLQQAIDFSQVVHTAENKAHSTAILDSQYERLSKNCKTLYDALKRGQRLSGVDCIKMGMIEYRRRFKDLKDAGIPVKSEMKGNVKEWFL